MRGGKTHAQPLIGEMAPSLMHGMVGKWGEGGPVAPALLRHVIPGAKLIFMLRNPVERTVAMYNAIQNPPATPLKSADELQRNVETFRKWYNMCTTKRQWSPRECLYGRANATEKLRPTKLIIHDVIHSIYHITINEWIKAFGRANVLVLEFDDYMANRLDVINKKVIPFLGIKPYSKGAQSFLEKTEADKTLKFETVIKTQASDETLETLKTFFAPFNKELSSLLNDNSFLWS